MDRDYVSFNEFDRTLITVPFNNQRISLSNLILSVFQF